MAYIIGPPIIFSFFPLLFAIVKMWRSCRRLEWWAHATHRELCYFHDDAQQKHYHHLSIFSVFIVLSRYNIVVTLCYWIASQKVSHVDSRKKLDHARFIINRWIVSTKVYQLSDIWIYRNSFVHRFKIFTFH